MAYIYSITFANILALDHCVADLHSGMGACYFISVHVFVKTQSLLDLHVCVS